MGRPVEFNDIENATPSTVAVTSTASTLSQTRLGKSRRKSFIIIPLTSGVTVTISKGDQAAVADAGIVLGQNQIYAEADSENFNCWQGTINVVASGNGNVAFTEVFES